ncbi:transposase [Nitrosomonas sp. Nm34]|uniref:transposase n=1 Tax=Nitrosomonas sp. Nm34 TaxID=1881055 RepID=UPI0034A4D2AE
MPPYAPNLNLIERYWKFFEKKILYGRYYETFSFFKSACEAFLAKLRFHSSGSLRSRIMHILNR